MEGGMRKQVIPVARYCNATRKNRVEDPKEGVTTKVGVLNYVLFSELSVDAAPIAVSATSRAVPWRQA